MHWARHQRAAMGEQCTLASAARLAANWTKRDIKRNAIHAVSDFRSAFGVSIRENLVVRAPASRSSLEPSPARQPSSTPIPPFQQVVYGQSDLRSAPVSTAPASPPLPVPPLPLKAALAPRTPNTNTAAARRHGAQEEGVGHQVWLPHLRHRLAARGARLPVRRRRPRHREQVGGRPEAQAVLDPAGLQQSTCHVLAVCMPAATWFKCSCMQGGVSTLPGHVMQQH